MNQITYYKTGEPTLDRPLAVQISPKRKPLLSSDEMQDCILRERDRSDQQETVFSIVVVSIPPEIQQVEETLRGRVRILDEIGYFEGRDLALLLPDTDPDVACQMAANLQEEFATLTGKSKVEVFSYPFREEPYDEPTSNDEPDTKLIARPLSFAMPMPWWKRGMDLIAATTILLLISPFLLLSAILIKLTSRGPIIFSQWREGRDGKKFKIYKLRSMVFDAESRQESLRHLSERDGPAFKMENDPRLTWIGRFLRRSCFDETPQFWNVLRGDMSLVGPRPLPINESRACTPMQRRRLDVTPGMTCFWQVAVDRNVSFDEWMRMDEKYVNEMSLWTDLKLLLQTLVFVFLRRASM